VVYLRAVLHKEATHARKFVGLRRQNNNVEVKVRKVCPCEFKVRRVV
jgi:hypothetical protein